MVGLSLILQFVLASVLVALALLSAQLCTLALVRYFKRPRGLDMPPLATGELPRVLVQLPVCDEGALAVRVAAAAARLDWPRDRLEIQVLDDGRAENHAALAAAVARVMPADLKFQVLRRGERAGFKAGNLAFGLKHSDAPYVAVFDADFVPPPDFLKRTVPALVGDPGLAFVQARWAHANRTRNWLTRAQGLLLDSHFAVEQEARYRAGLPMSFNGTAGVWSRNAIDHGGGWTGDTLTEDLDLSMRCVLKGWRSAMVSDLEVPGELPETAAAWRAQQARWTKGHAQVARKLIPEIWTSGIPLWKKAVITLQMCQFAFYLLAGASAVVSLTLMAMGVVYLKTVAALGLAVTALGITASVSYLYMGQAMLGREQAPCLARSLLLAIVFPSGLVLANTRATFEAFFNAPMDFVRTPKAGARYAGGWRGRPEITAGLLLPLFAFAEQAWSAPFFMFAAAGLLSIGAMGWNDTAEVPVREPAPGISPGE
jgi:cellulose synthase/poly-beta-1,6-N-acetylglucosamine synthase-like glycosyltransferase